jgi:hypothetical protein
MMTMMRRDKLSDWHSSTKSGIRYWSENTWSSMAHDQRLAPQSLVSMTESSHLLVKRFPNSTQIWILIEFTDTRICTTVACHIFDWNTDLLEKRSTNIHTDTKICNKWPAKVRSCSPASRCVFLSRIPCLRNSFYPSFYDVTTLHEDITTNHAHKRKLTKQNGTRYKTQATDSTPQKQTRQKGLFRDSTELTKLVVGWLAHGGNVFIQGHVRG